MMVMSNDHNPYEINHNFYLPDPDHSYLNLPKPDQIYGLVPDDTMTTFTISNHTDSITFTQHKKPSIFRRMLYGAWTVIQILFLFLVLMAFGTGITYLIITGNALIPVIAILAVLVFENK